MSISGSFQWSEDQTEMIFTPSSELENGELYSAIFGFEAATTGQGRLLNRGAFYYTAFDPIIDFDGFISSLSSLSYDSQHSKRIGSTITTSHDVTYSLTETIPSGPAQESRRGRVKIHFGTLEDAG